MHPSLRFWDVARKAGIAVLGVAGTALSMGYIPAPWDGFTSAGLAVLTYYGVYRTPNAPQSAQNQGAGTSGRVG
ncbi:MAG TPA: hypothetical protein VIY48_20140 [Candidatus Paceibacterota bacterium]